MVITADNKSFLPGSRPESIVNDSGLKISKNLSRRGFLKLLGVMTSSAAVGGVTGFVLAKAEAGRRFLTLAETLGNSPILLDLPYMGQSLTVTQEKGVSAENGVVTGIRLDKEGLTFQVMTDKDKTVRGRMVDTGGKDKKSSLFDADKYKPMPLVLNSENYWQLKNHYAIRLNITPEMAELAAVRVLPGVDENTIPVTLRDDQSVLIKENTKPWQIILDEKVTSKIKDGGFPIEDDSLNEGSLKLRSEDPNGFISVQNRADRIFKGEQTSDYIALRKQFLNNGFSESEFKFSLNEFSREQLINELVKMHSNKKS